MPHNTTRPAPKDPPRNKSIQDEVRDLLRRGTFKVILKEEIPDGANELTARYMFAIKSKVSQEIKFKACYVLKEHPDMLKHYLHHNAYMLQAQVARLLGTLLAILGFRVWSKDIKLAYLQSKKDTKTFHLHGEPYRRV